jgi:tRNA threonylcarbamoyladenosine biosynthesis protein TsaE
MSPGQRHDTFDLAGPADTDRLGDALARALGPAPRGVITLSGGLGAGKTHLVRALLRTLGVTGPVKSPTYTLVEPYETSVGRVLHMDLYRLAADDWWGLGLEDDPPDQCLWCVEWPEHAGSALPAPRLTIDVRTNGAGRSAELHWQNANDPASRDLTIHMNKLVQSIKR